jgi:hypothetical protein
LHFSFILQKAKSIILFLSPFPLIFSPKTEKEKAEKEGREWKNERYIPGRNIRGKIRENMDNNKRHSMSPSLSKIVALVSMVILFVLIYYFANYFGWFMNVL